MGNILGDIFFGGQSRTDRGQITDLYKTLGPLAKSATSAGQAGVGDAMSYARSLLHGDQAAKEAAIAPVTNAAEQQQEQRRRLLSSEGTARGGGVNAAEQAGADLGTKTSVDALTSLLPQAARESGQLGLAETGQGLQAGQQLGTLAEAERRTNLAHQAAEGSDLGKAIGEVAGAFAPVPAAPAFPNMTPGMISGAYGGPTSISPEGVPNFPIEEIPYLSALQPQ